MGKLLGTGQIFIDADPWYRYPIFHRYVVEVFDIPRCLLYLIKIPIKLSIFDILPIFWRNISCSLYNWEFFSKSSRKHNFIIII